MEFHRRLESATLHDHPYGRAVVAMLEQALEAVDPARAVLRALRRDGVVLHVGSEQFAIGHERQVVLLAVGKAALPMARAAMDVVGDSVVRGVVIAKEVAPDDYRLPPPIVVLQGGHPVPNEHSIRAGQTALELVSGVGPDDLVLALISGGGSALMAAPRAGLTLADLQALTADLLASGAPIEAMNTLRRRCDLVKGGGLARHSNGAQVAVLVLSDVLGDDLRAIASGPFVVADEEAGAVEAVLERYDLGSNVSQKLRDVLVEPVSAAAPRDRRISHTIVGNVWTAVEMAAATGRQHGFNVFTRHAALVGEARRAGPALIEEFERLKMERPACMIAGGETTVTIQGNGLGGRNQELALACVQGMAGRDVLLVTLATDGGDGPTDAAGAVVSGATLVRAQALGLDPDDALRRNDAYHFFAELDDLLKPGPTHTNVNDLTILVAP
ncbi:MAG: DUF4147 domain-containing protein [Herpetosiphonaceae bacterium]|nr:DUF4147 domain-containing protein [Herpetosiphonaceae bacterium]